MKLYKNQERNSCPVCHLLGRLFLVFFCSFVWADNSPFSEDDESDAPVLMKLRPSEKLKIAAPEVIAGKGKSVVLSLKDPAQASNVFMSPDLAYVQHTVPLKEKIDSLRVDDAVIYSISGKLLNIWEKVSAQEFRIAQRFDIGFFPSAWRVKGYIAYIGNLKGDLFILDFHDLAEPKELTYLHLDHGIQTLSRADGMLYVHMNNGDVVVFDTHDLLHPFVRDRFSISRKARGFYSTKKMLSYYRGQEVFYSYIETLAGSRREFSDFSAFDTGEKINDALFTNGLIYVAGAHGISVFEKKKNKWIWHSHYGGTGEITALALAGNRLVAVSESKVLYVFEVVRNDHLEVVAVMKLSAGYEGMVALNEQKIIAVSDTGMNIIDVSTKMPAYTNEYLDEGQGVNYGGQRKIYIDGKTMYVADWFSGMHIYDIRQPEKPRILANLHTPGSSKGVVVKNGIAYIADDDHGLQVADVHDPAHPAVIAELSLRGLAYTPVIDGKKLYMASHRGGIQVVDIRQPDTPVLLGELSTPGMAWFIQVKDGIVWVADDEAGVLSVDAEFPETMHLLDQWQPGGRVEDILLDGDYAYVAIFDKGVSRLDISNPEKIVEVGHIDLPGNARGLDLVGGHLFVASWKAGVYVLDKDTLQILSHQDTPGAAWGVKVKDHTVFVADWWAGMMTLTISDAGKLSLVDQPSRRDYIYDLSSQGNFLYAAQGNAGLQVFEVSNGMNPTWAAGVDAGRSVFLIKAHENALYAGGSDQTILIYDISNPFEPDFYAQLYLDDSPEKITVEGRTLFVSTRLGLRLFDITDPLQPELSVNIEYPVSDFEVTDGSLVVLESPRVLSLWRVNPDNTLAILQRISLSGSVHSLAMDSGILWLNMENGSVQKLALSDIKQGKSATTVAVSSSGGKVLDMLVNDDILYALREEGVTLFDMHGGDSAARFLFPVMSSVKGMFWSNDVLYLSGTWVPIALDLAYPVVDYIKGAPRVQVRIPFGVPTGDYALREQSASGVSAVSHQAMQVKQFRFSKPRISPKVFQELLEKHRIKGAVSVRD